MNMAELSEVHGRAWEDVDVSSCTRHYCLLPNNSTALIH